MVDSEDWQVPYASLEAVFFDVGGTLLTINFEAVQRELSEVGHLFSVDQIEREEARARPAVSYALQKKGGTAEDFATVYMASIMAGLDFSSEASRTEAAVHLRQSIYPPFGRSDELWNRPLERADHVLTELKKMGLPIVAVSNSDGSAARSLDRAGLAHHFEHIIDSHLVGYAKPDPRIFEPALAAVQVDPARTLYVGDIYAGDIVGCRAAGLHGLLLNPFGDYEGVDCETISCLTEIPIKIAASRKV